MARRRLLAVAAGFLVAGVALASGLAAAHDSTTEALVRTLGSKLFFLGVTIGVVTEVALWYAVVKYRNTGDAKETTSNVRFHLAFVGAVSLVLLFVGFTSYQTMAEMNETTPAETELSEDAVRVHVVAQQWLWTFEYPEANVTSRETLVVPVGRTVALNLTTKDVIHSFHVPALGLKQDVVPGWRNELVFTPTETGEYQLYCAEYCGQRHSKMLGTVRVINETAYERWLAERGERTRRAKPVVIRWRLPRPTAERLRAA